MIFLPIVIFEVYDGQKNPLMTYSQRAGGPLLFCPSARSLTKKAGPSGPPGCK